MKPDTNSSLPSNNTHPINVWTNSSITIPGLHPSSSLGFTDYLYCQLADETINGNITIHPSLSSHPSFRSN